MNKIIEDMAREAGGWVLSDPEPGFVPRAWGITDEGMERLARAIAKRCAEICRTTDLFVDEWKAGEKCAAAIREHFGIEGE